jgi:hypothetical protein
MLGRWTPTINAGRAHMRLGWRSGGLALHRWTRSWMCWPVPISREPLRSMLLASAAGRSRHADAGGQRGGNGRCSGRSRYLAAVERASGLLAGYRRDLEQAEAGEWGALLLHDTEPVAGSARALARERGVTPPYAAYQRVLNTHLHGQADAGRFAETIVVSDRPILDVHHELGLLLRDTVSQGRSWVGEIHG